MSDPAPPAQEGLADLEAAVDAAPADYDAVSRLGVAYGLAGRNDEAVAVLTRAVDLQPGNALARCRLALAMERAAWPDQAVQVYRQALQLDPELAEARAGIARLAPPTPPPPAVPVVPPLPPTAAARAVCSNCGGAPQPVGAACPICGGTITSAPSGSPPPGMAYAGAQWGVNGPMPDEIARLRWHWGAFQFTWLWLCFHRLVLAGIVLLLIDVLARGAAGGASVILLGVAIANAIWFGRHGYRIAWRRRPYASVEQFFATEGAWARWGLALFIVSMVVGVIYVIVEASHGLPPSGSSRGDGLWGD